MAEPVVVELRGTDSDVTEAGHVVLRFGTHSRATVVLNHTGHASMAQVVEVVVGDGAAGLGHLAAGLGRRRRPPHAPPDAGRPRRDVQARGGQLRRRRRPDGHQRDVRRSRRVRRAARPLLRRRRPAHRAPPLRRPRRAPHQEQRGLQGRAAGPGRAHRVDRQRADPQGRRGHRDLRGEPQPRAQRRLPRRLGPQPGDRDRRDRGGRPRRAPPPASTTSSCSTSAPAASTTRRPAASSCTASSTT